MARLWLAVSLGAETQSHRDEERVRTRTRTRAARAARAARQGWPHLRLGRRTRDEDEPDAPRPLLPRRAPLLYFDPRALLGARCRQLRRAPLRLRLPFNQARHALLPPPAPRRGRVCALLRRVAPRRHVPLGAVERR